MIRISRPKQPPSFLTSDRVTSHRKDLLTYLRRGESERRERRDGLNEDFFFDAEWLSEIGRAFKGKCAFCETKLDGQGRTLHFRPQRYVDGANDGQLDYYLWLAFEWRNLFYACYACIKAKGNRFPVAGDRADYLATFDEVLKQEASLIVDPTAQNPDKHFRFLVDGTIESISEEGDETVIIFYLNRIELVTERQRVIADMLAYLDDPVQLRRLDYLLNDDSAHLGAALQVLKRITRYWRPESPIRGNGERFVHNLMSAIRFASDEEIRRLRLATDAEVSGRLVQIEDTSAPLAFRRQTAVEPLFTIHSHELSRIRISRFKAVEELTLRFPTSRAKKAGMPAMIILGENSMGKSSVLCSIALALIGYREAEKLKNYFPGLVQSTDTDTFDQLDDKRVSVKVDFFFKKASAWFEYDPVHRSAKGGDEPTVIVLGYGARRFFNTNIKDRRSGAAARVRTLFDPLATIPYPGEWLRAQTGKRLATISSALRTILALNDDDELIVEPTRLAVRANGQVTSIDALSEGYRSVFVMTVDIIRELIDSWDHLEEAQAVVLIDELETHLHPRWKMQVMTSLRRVFPKVQFIVTTHDPLCLRGMDDGEVVVLQRDMQNKIVSLSELPPVSGMTAEQLLTSDYFGLASTTDPGAEIELATLAGDVARRSVETGELEIALSESTVDLVQRLTIGDSPTNQIVQDALMQYLEKREARNGELRPRLRAEAVEEVLTALLRRDS
ncbi:AAA family ATPase [Pseudomonas viridiflava]|uniref:AAA family ATPase n=1 Tax=Pseudomonas viridiflava TaxID=33069 RepID=UPI000F03625D|nr:AAA family ATPase [Pseudomonas viridiflava]